MEERTNRETHLASIKRTGQDQVEVHFKPGSRLTSNGISEILDVRERLGAEGPHKVLIVLPAEVDFDMSMITTDHHRGRPVKEVTRAIAWVAGSETTRHLTKLYLSYFPPAFPTKVFTGEEEARLWLAAN